MLKSVTRLLLFITLILTSIVYFIIGFNSNIDRSPIPVLVNNSDEDSTLIDFLNGKEYKYISRDNFSIIINDYPELKSFPYSSISSKLDPRDYRYTPYLTSIEKLFSVDGKEAVYILRDKSLSFKTISLVVELLFKGFNIYDSNLLSEIAGVISLLILIILVSIGSKVRSLSLISLIPLYLLLGRFSLTLYIALYIFTISLVFFYEISVTDNRYIRRNRLGVIRSILIVLTFLLPIFCGKIFQSKEFLGVKEISYESLEEEYLEDIPNTSNLFAHYSYQSSVLYDFTYGFPSLNSTVNINEFKINENSLELYNNEVLIYNEDFLNSFLEYLKESPTGRFYLDWEGRDRASHIQEKEYMQICILAVIMLISLLLLKKR